MILTYLDLYIYAPTCINIKWHDPLLLIISLWNMLCILRMKKKPVQLKSALDRPTNCCTLDRLVYRVLLEMYFDLALWCSGDPLDQILRSVNGSLKASITREPTKLSNTHLFKGVSNRLHLYNCWFALSKHFQWARNSCRQCLLRSAILSSSASHHVTPHSQTHTLAAHLVTRRPSFMQSNSPRPFDSSLQSM